MRKILLLVTIVTLALFSFKNVKISQQTLEGKIIGTWFYEKSATSKLVFDTNGRLSAYYSGNKLRYSGDYSISHSCGSNSDINFYFLKVVYDDGDEVCYEINGINENNSGILSLTSMNNGKVSLYVNDPNIQIPD